MNNIDFSTYKFRCSSLPTLMVNGRSKSEVLSETAKAALRELWIREKYKREKFDTSNKYTEKGIMCEPDAMKLVEEVTGKTYFKNETRFSNDFIEGTPDIVLKPNTPEAHIKDMKCSWDIWTYAAVDEATALKSYYYQMLGYMWLTGAKLSDLDFCLVNTPEDIMWEELRKLSYKYPEIDQSEEAAERFKRNYIFDDIPAKERLKEFSVEFNEADVELLKERIIAARAYLGTLSL